MPDSKSPISEEDILFIGIPGVKNNLTLNLENPLGPGETLWGEGGEPMPRVEPAGILTEYKIIIVDPDDLGAIHNPSHVFEIRRGQLRIFIEQGGLLVCILRKADGVKNFKSSENVMNYDFIVQYWGNYTKPYGGVIKKFGITNEGYNSSFVKVLKEMQELSIYLNEIKPIWGETDSINMLKVDVKPLAVGSNRKVVAFEAIPMKIIDKKRVPTEDPFAEYDIEYVWGLGLGKMIFLPDPALNNVPLLVECAKQEYSQMGTAGFVPAEWTRNYAYPEREKHASEIDSLKSNIKSITKEIETKEKSLAELDSVRDILLNGTGIPLQRQVRQVLNEMNIPFEDGPPKLEDLALKKDLRTLMVVEVKGKTKTADKVDLMKLMSWVNRIEKEENSPSPKGLLVINAWREDDPKGRTKPAFPDPIEKIGAANEFCLMTTVQLFNMWCAFKKGEFKGGEELLNQIIEAKGVFPGFDDPKANRI